MKTGDLIQAERGGMEEGEPLIPEREIMEFDDLGNNPDSVDEAFCTAAGAASVKPSGRKSSLTRMLNAADRA